MFLNPLQPKPTPTTPPWATTDIASEPTVPELTTIPAVSSSEVTQETTTSSQSTFDYGSSSLGDLLSGQNLQGAIDNIVDMGFPRDEVMRAILARSNNADRTVGYRTEVSAFTTFSECFKLIYYIFSRDSHILRFILTFILLFLLAHVFNPIIQQLEQQQQHVTEDELAAIEKASIIYHS